MAKKKKKHHINRRKLEKEESILIAILLVLIPAVMITLNSIGWSNWQRYGRMRNVEFYVRYKVLGRSGKTRVQWRAINNNNIKVNAIIEDKTYYLVDGTSIKAKDAWSDMKPGEEVTFFPDKKTPTGLRRVEAFFRVEDKKFYNQ